MRKNWKLIKFVFVACLLAVATSIFGAIGIADFIINDYIQHHQPVIIVPTSTLETPTPNVYPTPPTVTPTPSATPGIRIGSQWKYVLTYEGQGKSQTPVFVASNKFIVHWQCYLPNGAGRFNVNVYERNGREEQAANIWDCKQGHTSGNSPVYCSGQYFVSLDPGKKDAKYTFFIEIYK